MVRWFMLRSVLAASMALLAAGAHARTLEVGPGKAYPAPSAAVAAAEPGDRILIAPGEYADCAVLTKNDVTIEGAGDPAEIVLTDKICEGKAILVLRGENALVRNLTLQRARVPDDNGAGIRGESRSITVDGVRFIGNQNGILSGTDGGTMTVRNSYFEKNGFCGAACAHGIYAGHLDLLHVEGSHFIDTRQAHHIKSRARRTEVIGCNIQDGPDGTASYEVEAPNGGSLVVRGSIIVKGPKAENHTAAIMIGSEGVTQPTREIVVAGNVFRNDGSYPTVFVSNGTDTPAQVSDNAISGVGPVRTLKGGGTVTGSK